MAGWLAAAVLGMAASAWGGQPAQQPGMFAEAPASTPLGGIYSYQGLPVSQVQFRGFEADPHVMQQLNEAVAQKVNQPLERRNIGDSLRALYATGRFADLQVEAERTSENGVSLVFVGRPNYFVANVTLEGAPKRPTATQLLDVARLELGQLYTRARLDHGIEQMKSLLEDNGYYRPAIHDQEQYNEATQGVDITFSVDPGPPAKVGQVQLEGTPGYSVEEVRRITGLEPGRTVTEEGLTKALDRLRKRYNRQGRLEAQVAVSQKNYHPDTNQLDYTFRIDPGPVVNITVAGADISRRNMRNFVPVYEEHAVDEDLLNEGRRNIRDYLQNQGFFDSTVAFKREVQADQLNIVYQVERGSRHELVLVSINGNHYFPTDVLRERLEMQPAGWLLSHGRFSQEMLARDVDGIRNLYLANGFRQVQIGSEVKDDYQGVTSRMAVLLHINEGPQTLVSRLTIVGNNNVAENQIRPLLTTIEDQPYSETNTATDRDLVMNYYFNHGFPEASFQSSATPDPDQPNRMQVTYTITEGRQVFVDRMLLSGLESTRYGIVRRQFQLSEGDPLSQGEMLDTQRRLYDLGVFNQVQMAVQNPEGDSRYKDVMFNFQEARRWTFTYGGGIEIQSGTFGARDVPQGKESVSPRVTLDITRLNVGGRAHTLTFQSDVGRLLQQGSLTYAAPRLLNHQGLNLTLSALYDNSLNVNTFTSERLEGALQLEQIVSRATTLLYRFTYERVRATQLVVSPDQIPLFSKPVRVGMPSLTYIRDHRDDPIDSHSGNYTTFDTAYASNAFGSEATFGRLLAQNATYTPFRKKSIVFARSLRVGVAEPFGNTAVLPLPLRFFAGGVNTLRGFGLNQAGPRDLSTGQPLGGNALLVNNFELRLPPPTLPFVGKDLSFVLFHDAGNVFATTSDMGNSLLQWKQKNAQLCTSAATASLCDFNYISNSVGTGLRYHTPIGPVRLDFGYNLNPPKFPVFTTNPNGTTSFQAQTLSHFNLYFSIGQTF